MKAITVMIPVYNSEAFIRETIDSVLCQTFTDFEILALDDGSTDDSAAIIQSFTDPRVKYVPCTHDFIGTLNKGLELADSKYIAFIDHDDMMLSYRLKTQYDFMEANPDIAASGGFMLSFGQYSTIAKVPLVHKTIIQTMLMCSPILNPTAFIRKKFLTENHIQYERGYSYSTDYKLWSEIGKIGKLANIPKILTLYRVHEEQTSMKYYSECFEGGQSVKLEMIDYFFSHLKEVDELTNAIVKDFIPAIEELGETGIFSYNTFFQLMHEMVCCLMEKGSIEI